MQSWFQKQERFSLRGKIHWRIGSVFTNVDNATREDLLALYMIQGRGYEMHFSRDALLKIVGTDEEESFFNSMLDMINGKEVTLAFKEGGGKFCVPEGQSSVDAYVDYLMDGYKWNKVFDELRLKGNVLERILDKGCEWVAEFFEMLLEYAKRKYPQSFEKI